MADDSKFPVRTLEREDLKAAHMREPTGETARVAAEPTGVHRSRRLRRILFMLGPVALVLVGLYLYLNGGRYVSTDNAYVKADSLSIATDVPGFVAEIDVKENERVDEGQVLMRLDEEPFRIALAAAQAQLGVIRNEIEALQATYRQNLAQVEQARADLTYFESQFERQQALIKKQATTQTIFEQAQRDLENARERVTVAQREAEATLANLGGEPMIVSKTIRGSGKPLPKSISLHATCVERSYGLP